ncbi:MAG: hypothetical protein Q8L49_00915 [Burkholderiaceae bacterium]|nr:hypothetical protein [Burkholderiaceae bacterium]
MTRKRPHKAAPAAFSAGWLQQREPFDAAARTAAAARLALAARLAALRPEPATPWRVIDLACGTGANLRWLAPRLGGPQQWLVVDHDAALLQRWPQALESAAGSAADRALDTTPPMTTGPAKRGAHLDAPLRLQGPGYAAAIVRRQIDLAQHLEALPWHAAHLVTASALLDLASAHWLRRLVAAAASARVALLFALSVDGRQQWQPPDPADAAVAALFCAHQRRDKGFGPALGPRAASVLLRALRAAGYHVHRARSDWRLDSRGDPLALALQRSLLDGMATAACEQDPAAALMVQGWQRRRRACAAQGSVRVGHLDLLALPPPV